MLTLINVTCPHCAAKGQVMVPPLGAIIIGSCPECQKAVCLFNGIILALDDEIITGSDRDLKCEHLLEVMTDYLRGCVERMLDETNNPAAPDTDRDKAGRADNPRAIGTVTAADLALLDDKDAFNRIFKS